MKVGLYYYEKVLKDVSLIQSLKENLIENGFSVSLFTDPLDISDVDVLVVLGGDGTILPAAIACGKMGIPVLGINYGHLGFLTELERAECLDLPTLLKQNAFLKEKRSAIKVTVGSNEFYALNEVSVQRQYKASYRRQVISLSAEIDGKLIDRYQADGLLVSTPTGSTGYALSAGGAVLSPDLEAFMLAPICAHSLRSRPVVYSDKRKLILSLDENYGAEVFCDGRNVATISHSEKVVVEKANFSVVFLVRQQTNFYDKLFYKMNQWGGGKSNDS